jgi:ParB-like chromosome segregation protein Spo0J
MKHSKLTTQAPSAPALARSDPGLAKRGGDVIELRSPLLRDIVVEQCRLTNLKTNPRNARTHSKRQIKAIAASIEQFGFTTPLLIDDDGMILAGHGRLQAAKLLGLDRVPTIRISGLSEVEKRAFVLAENRLAQRAGWNRELLALELGELSYLLPDLGLTVDLTGFEVREAELIVNGIEQSIAAAAAFTKRLRMKMTTGLLSHRPQ